MSERVFASSAPSDFTVVCNSRQYHVHRKLLACHSTYFKTCFSSKFREANESRIELKEDPPEAVRAMMQYFYRLDYDVEIEEDPNETQRLLLERHSSVYTVAEKYQVADLKELSRVKFATALVNGDGGIYYAVPHIFDSTLENDYGLRDICLISYAVSIHVEKESGNCDEFSLAGLIKSCKTTLVENPDLAAELATFALFSQAGLLKSRNQEPMHEKESENVVDDVLRYLSIQKGGLRRAERSRVLVDKLGRAGW